jgi:mycoredoxin
MTKSGRTGGTVNEPIVYFKPGCPFGIRLRTALTLHRVPHRSVRFRDDEEAATHVRAVNGGNEISPTVHIAGRWLPNPAWREVRDAASGVGPRRGGLEHETNPEDVLGQTASD